ncbi:MAG TPA: hypothetical protein VGN19_05765 [Pedococcus sp.]|jgi:hypothetical protein|nr:hypothetical protein [Pedococcus sp.]
MTEPETVEIAGVTYPVIRDDRLPKDTFMIAASTQRRDVYPHTAAEYVAGEADWETLPSSEQAKVIDWREGAISVSAAELDAISITPQNPGYNDSPPIPMTEEQPMPYEIINAERTASIACPHGGFDVTLDGKTVQVKHVDVSATVVDGKVLLSTVTLSGPVMRKDGRFGERHGYVAIWPEMTPVPFDEAEDFLPWHTLPSNLQHTICQSVGVTG